MDTYWNLVPGGNRVAVDRLDDLPLTHEWQNALSISAQNLSVTQGRAMHDLNDIDIAKMPAGREMDKLIDKYVLGHTVLQYQSSESYINSRPWMISFYSTIIGAAWEVLTHFSRQGVTIHLSIDRCINIPVTTPTSPYVIIISMMQAACVERQQCFK